MDEKFDAIVVGAGPSGNAAAYTLAKAGLKVLQIERGEYPGSKNVQGAILYSKALEEIIPDFRDDAPLERHVIEQRVWVLDDASFVGTHAGAIIGLAVEGIQVEDIATTAKTMPDFPRLWADMLAQGGAAPQAAGAEGGDGGPAH